MGQARFTTWGRALAHQVRNRRAAASYLAAATITSDPIERERLRRRAAWLIAPYPGDWCRRLAG